VNAAAQFASDIVLAGRSGASLEAHSCGVAVERFNAENARAVHEGLRPGCIGAKFGASSFEGRERLIERNFGGEGNVDVSLRPIAAKVGHGANVTVGDGDESAAGVANDRAAQRQMFNAAVRIANLDCVSDHVLIFEDDVETRDNVADKILRAESDGDTGEAREREGRSGVDAEKIESCDERDNPDDFAERAVENAGQSYGLLFAYLRRARLICRRLDNELGQNFEETIDEQREQNNAEKMERCG